jgi:hypothetical protein
MQAENKFGMFGRSSNIEVIITTVREAAVLVILMGGIYEVCH